MNEKENQKDWLYLVTYLFGWITGIIIYFVKGGDNRFKAHAVQAIVLGVVASVFSFLSFSIISLLIWIYGMYIGFQAYNGKDVSVPFMPGFANSQSETTESKSEKKLKIAEDIPEHESIKELKIRYAKGDITKKQYLRMKKELEE